MPVVPAFCPRCDAIFTPKGAIAIAALDQNLNIPGDETPCAHCGAQAVILDGIFDFVGDATRLLSDAHCTADELQMLGAVLTDARRERSCREKVVEDVGEAAPGLGHLVDRLLPQQGDRLFAAYSLLIYFTFDVLALRHNRHIDVDVNITPYLTVLIDRMIKTRPWRIAEPRVRSGPGDGT